jgi:hypothetical protein
MIIKTPYINGIKSVKIMNNCRKPLAVAAPNKTGILNESIIWNYFIKGIKKFSDITFNNSTIQ